MLISSLDSTKTHIIFCDELTRITYVALELCAVVSVIVEQYMGLVSHRDDPRPLRSVLRTVRLLWDQWHKHTRLQDSFPVAQIVEHGASNAKIMGLIPRESKSW